VSAVLVSLVVLLNCLSLFDYVVLFWANKYDDDDDDDDDDEGKTNFSRRLKQFDTLNWLTRPSLVYDRSTQLLNNDYC